MSRRFGIALTAAFLALLALAPAAAVAEGSAEARRIGPFAVDTLEAGVHLFRPADAGSGRPNSLVVERDDGVLVVDGQATPAAAKELLEAIGKLTPKPVRFLVYSHPHADAAGGASGFPREVLVVSSDGCRASLADPSFDFGSEERALEGEGWQEPARRLPTAVTSSELRLEDSKHPVQILPIQAKPAHSAGDTLVWLHDDGIVVVGDLIAPFRGVWSRGANLGNWIGVLNDILSEQPKIVVPLHGPATDARDVRLTRDAFNWVRGRVQQGFVDHVPTGIIPDRVLESVDLAQYFDPSAPRPILRDLIEQAVREAIEWRRKHGFN